MATVTERAPARPGMSIFERYLSIWVALCIVAGIALGAAAPGLFALVASAEIARVNLPVALLVWLMIIPMLLKIDFGALGQVRRHMRGVGVTLFVNWAVKPFSMALLGAIFIGWLFRPLLPADQIDSYIAGLILLAAAPCTAMVFVWSNLCEGEPHYTLSQVALNDLIRVFAFAPLVGLLRGVDWQAAARGRPNKEGRPGGAAGSAEVDRASRTDGACRPSRNRARGPDAKPKRPRGRDRAPLPGKRRAAGARP